MTIIAEAPAPTTIVFGTDGWRATHRRRLHVRERPTLRRGRRPLRRGPRRAQPRASSSPTTGASPASSSPRPRPRSCSPTTSRSSSPRRPCRPRCRRTRSSSAGPPRGIVITASRTTRGPTTGSRSKRPTGSAAGPDILAALEATIRATAGRRSPRRPFADAEAAGPGRALRPVPGYEAFVAPDARPRRAARRPTSTSWSSRCGAPGAGWISPAAGRRPDPGDGDPPGAQPVLRRRQPRAHPAQHRRGAGHPGRRAATTWACCSTATPTARARPTSGARSSTSSR